MTQTVLIGAGKRNHRHYCRCVPGDDIAEPEKIALISGNVTTADSVKLPDEIKQLLLTTPRINTSTQVN
ncbi:MAG: hypothetical protein ACLS48_04215 [[Eubacterium] siraeum]